ncbi:ATP synthase subunit b, mitochondrial [Agrilus planipennis]|uniref:ATP synthase subunit b n=1 Tax=Agrilus planipennis TaxID=224129 RepID=A0A1W4WEV8_AGRPL|nr:ATP synthase subunit b, mitochondrial [Agrilus planipennis]
MMLSRGAILTNQQAKALLAFAARTTTTTPVSSASAVSPSSGGSQFPRPVRQEPGKVRLGFVPEEWFQFFYKKTGVTGPYVFATTLSTYLISKEIYVMEHEYYTGLSLLIFCIVGVKKLGPPLAKYLDKEIDEYEKAWNSGREEEKKILAEQIEDEKNLQKSAEGQLLLTEAKKQNVALQLEAAYRARLFSVYETVKKRLDYQVARITAERQVHHKNLVDYVVRKVLASITPDQEKANINKCIADLKTLSKAR